MKNLIIIGAGTAGTTVANHLQTKLPSDWQLKVIDPEPRHLFQPDLIFLPFGMQTPEKMERPRKSTFRRDVEWLQKEVFAVDTDARQVVLDDDERVPYDLLIIASGSEIALAKGAAKELSSEGVKVRVVSMPNPDCFMRQDEAYRDSVLPPELKARVAVEAGVTAGWASFVGDGGRVIGVDRFGASAPAGVLFEHYGLTASAVSEAVRDSLAAGN